MKQIKAFELITGLHHDYDITRAINNEIQKLNEKGINTIDLNITSTGEGVIYTLIWNQ